MFLDVSNESNIWPEVLEEGYASRLILRHRFVHVRATVVVNIFGLIIKFITGYAAVFFSTRLFAQEGHKPLFLETRSGCFVRLSWEPYVFSKGRK